MLHHVVRPQPMGPLVTTAPPSPRHERTRQVSISCAVIAAAAVVCLFTGSSPVTASGILPGNNPKANIAPSPDFVQSGACVERGASYSCANPCVDPSLEFPAIARSSRCTAYVLQALNDARRVEGLKAMALPTTWSRLSVARQLFVLADLERTARGLPPYLGLNAALTADAQHAAAHDEDPTIAAGFAIGRDPQGYEGMGGAWSSGFTVLGADYFWMYADGWGGSGGTYNAACTSNRAPGCWAHRDELLGFDPRYNPGVGLACRTCEMGTGFAITRGAASFVDLIELPAGAPPAMTFTWAKDVRPYLTAAPPRKVVETAAMRRSIARRRARVHPLGATTSRPSAATCPLPSPKASPWGRHGCRHTTFKVGRHRAVTLNREER